MRVVADTNIVVSGLLWRGHCYGVLNAARQGVIRLFVSPALLIELEDVLGREKLRARLEQANVRAQDLIHGYAALAGLVRPGKIEPVITADPDDDEVLACARAVQADMIVSGDTHLLALREFDGIPIVTARECLARIAQR